MKKKILSIILVIIVLITVGVVVFKNKITSSILQAVSSQASKITKTKVSIKDVSISFLQAKIIIDKLDVGNPKGYNNPTALGFNKLIIDLELASMLSDTIVIDEITINGLKISFETDVVSNNLSKLKENIDNSTTKTEKQQQTEPTTEKTTGKSKKFIIRKLNINNASMIVAVKHVKGSNVPIKLADIHLKDIGTTENSATPSYIAEKLISAILASSLKSVHATDVIPKNIEIKDIKDKTNKALKSIKNLF